LVAKEPRERRIRLTQVGGQTRCGLRHLGGRRRCRL